MKVKIGNYVFDSNDTPIMLLFDNEEHKKIMAEQISSMPNNLKYCNYPDKKEWVYENYTKIKKWMAEDGTPVKLADAQDVLLLKQVPEIIAGSCHGCFFESPVCNAIIWKNAAEGEQDEG